MIITIDGPAGTGKTTVARNVAQRLDFVYFDTGAMYRAFAWFVLQQKIDINDPDALARVLDAFEYQITQKNEEKHYFVGSTDVTAAIRSPEVTSFVSPLSALKQVRTHFLSLQHHFAKTQNAVFEGRDLGTVVFPQAEIKIFLDADPSVRAKRRLQEVLTKQPEGMQGLTHEQMLEEMLRRDAQDSNREVAPLRCPVDALKIDTTFLSIDQVVDQIVNYCVQQFPNKKFL